MKLKVLEYMPGPLNYHICEDEAGDKHRVDIMVDGQLKGTNQDQIGKTIECETLDPFIEIANGVTPS